MQYPDPTPASLQSVANNGIGLFSGSKVNVTPESFMKARPSYKFRIGVDEAVVTNFSPTSAEFINSVRRSALSMVANAALSSPLIVEPKHISLGTTKNIKQITNFSDVKLVHIRGTGTELFRSYAFDSSLNIDSINVVSTVPTFKDLIVILRRAWLSSEETGETAFTFLGIKRTPTGTLESKTFKRLINVYEPIPNTLFCFSFIIFTGDNPDGFIIANYWLNRYSFEQNISDTLLVPVYVAYGLPYIMASIHLRHLGISIHPLGFAQLNVLINGETTSIPLSTRQTEYALGSLGALAQFCQNHIGTDINRIFRLSRAYCNLQNFGLEHSGISQIRVIPNSKPRYDSSSPIAKFLVDAIIKNNYSINTVSEASNVKTMLKSITEFDSNFSDKILLPILDEKKLRVLLRDKGIDTSEKIEQFENTAKESGLPDNFFSIPEFKDKLVFDN
jgi:hypothetical protein